MSCSSASLFLHGSNVLKDPTANARDVGLIPGSERLPGEGYGNPLQHSSPGNPIDRAVHSQRVRHDLVTEQR